MCCDKDVVEVACGAGIGLGILSRNAKDVIGGDINTKVFDVNTAQAFGKVSFAFQLNKELIFSLLYRRHLDSQQKLSYQQTIDYNTSSNNHYSVGEIVSQVVASGITVTGEVQTVTKTSTTAGTITVSNIGVSGTTTATDFIVSTTIPLTGNTSSESCNNTKKYDIGDNSENVFPSDGGAENVAFEVSADGFLDFSEANPFGDPSDNY